MDKMKSHAHVALVEIRERMQLRHLLLPEHSHPSRVADLRQVVVVGDHIPSCLVVALIPL